MRPMMRPLIPVCKSWEEDGLTLWAADLYNTMQPVESNEWQLVALRCPILGVAKMHLRGGWETLAFDPDPSTAGYASREWLRLVDAAAYYAGWPVTHGETYTPVTPEVRDIIRTLVIDGTEAHDAYRIAVLV